MITNELLSPAEAGRRLGLSVDRIRQLVDHGRLEATRTPLGRLIDAGSVEALAAERAAQRVQSQ